MLRDLESAALPHHRAAVAHRRNVIAPRHPTSDDQLSEPGLPGGDDHGVEAHTAQPDPGDLAVVEHEQRHRAGARLELHVVAPAGTMRCSPEAAMVSGSEIIILGTCPRR